MLKFDERKFGQYYKDMIFSDHPIISLGTKHSLMEPLTIRLVQLFFSLSLNFALNAIFYSDDYIEAHANTVIVTGKILSVVNNSIINFKQDSLIDINDLPKSAFAVFIAAFIVFIFNKILEPSEKVEEKFNEDIISENENRIKRGQ